MVMIWRFMRFAAIGIFSAWAISGPDSAIRASADIAFASRRDGNWEIYVMDEEGQNQRRLTRRDAEDRFPLWSPNRGQMAFASMSGTSWDTWDLWVMNSDGSKERRLATQIVAKSTRGWSPDGSLIAFTAVIDDNMDVYLVDVVSGEVTRLTWAPGEDRDPSWSPDGMHLTFSSSRDGTPQVYLMDFDGRNQRRLTNATSPSLLPSWSPDGTTILFASDGPGGRDLYLISASGGDPQRLTIGARVTRDPPLWSPDGSLIVFQIADGENYDIGVTRVSAMQRSFEVLAGSPAYDGSYTWSPDGQHIVFISARDGFDAVYIADSNGKGVIRHTDSASLSPAWGSQR